VPAALPAEYGNARRPERGDERQGDGGFQGVPRPEFLAEPRIASPALRVFLQLALQSSALGPRLRHGQPPDRGPAFCTARRTSGSSSSSSCSRVSLACVLVPVRAQNAAMANHRLITRVMARSSLRDFVKAGQRADSGLLQPAICPRAAFRGSSSDGGFRYVHHCAPCGVCGRWDEGAGAVRHHGSP
jgi:hypothetical protein